MRVTNTFYMDQILEVRHSSPEAERDLCLKLLEEKSEYSTAFARTYLADAYHSMGMLDKAMSEYHKAMPLAQKNHYESLSLTLHNLAGVIYIDLDDEQGALDSFFKEIEIAERRDNYMMCSVALANIAYVYRGAGAFDKAESTLNRAHDMAKIAEENESNADFSEDFYHMLRAGLALERKNSDLALEHLHSITESKWQSMDIVLLFAACYALKGEKNTALRKVDRVWEDVEDIRNRFERLSHYFDILDIYITLEEYERAELVIEKAEKLLVRMDIAGKWSKLMEYEIKVYTAMKSDKKLERAYRLFYEYDLKFKEFQRKAAVKRLKKRIELQEEAEKRASMEAWQNVLAKRSEYDELTGVLNRRGMRKYMNSAFSRAKFSQESFAVLIVDVDFFKEFNDTYGHVAGDECLKKIAEILKSAVKKNGMVGRYGGDEFLLTFAGEKTSMLLEYALGIKEALERAAIENKNSTVSEFVTVTIGGLNIRPSEEKEISFYIDEADKVLYRLKKCSKNGFTIVDSLQGGADGQDNRGKM